MWLNDTKGLCINSSPCRRAQGPTYLAQEKLYEQVLLFIKTATYQSLWASQVVQCYYACQCRRRKNQGLIPDWEDLPEEEMATHSSILAWEIPWTKKPGGLHSPWDHKRVGHKWAHMHIQICSVCIFPSYHFFHLSLPSVYWLSCMPSWRVDGPIQPTSSAQTRGSWLQVKSF